MEPLGFTLAHPSGTLQEEENPKVNPLPSKDSYLKAFGPKDPYDKRLSGYFDAKG